MQLKSSKSLRKTVVLKTMFKDEPALSRMFPRFRIACSACFSIPSGIVPLSGTIGSCPDMKTRLNPAVPWEYGPIAAGALAVSILCIIKYPFLAESCIQLLLSKYRIFNNYSVCGKLLIGLMPSSPTGENGEPENNHQSHAMKVVDDELNRVVAFLDNSSSHR